MTLKRRCIRVVVAFESILSRAWLLVSWVPPRCERSWLGITGKIAAAWLVKAECMRCWVNKEKRSSACFRRVHVDSVPGIFLKYAAKS